MQIQTLTFGMVFNRSDSTETELNLQKRRGYARFPVRGSVPAAWFKVLSLTQVYRHRWYRMLLKYAPNNTIMIPAQPYAVANGVQDKMGAGESIYRHRLCY